MSSKSRGGRSSMRPPAAEEGIMSEPQDIAPPADTGYAPGAEGDDMPAEAPAPPAPRGPVSVGRSLEITSTPDVCMEMLVDKLKLLNYETDFCKKKKPYRKPLSRQHFVFEAPNKSEQFFYFTSLTAWLLSLAGVEVPTPKEFDDPNITCTNLLNAVRKLGFAPPSYAPIKLTLGSGKEVCGVLDGLVDYVLEKKGFQYRRPMYQPEAGGDETAVDDEAESAAMEGSDELARPEPLQDDDEDEEAFVEAPAPSSSSRAGTEGGAAADKAGGGGGDGAEVKAPLISRVDPIAWRVELERVAPRLRITVAADAKDWRSHLDEAHQHQETITKAWPDSKVSLEKLRGDLNASLEKLMTREKILNEQFEHLMQQYRGTRTGLTGIQDTYNKKTEGVADRNAELHRIAEQLEEIKANMDEKGSNITDATPVVRIKTAIKKLNEELHDMEVRIGVVSHSLLQLSLRNKRDMQAAAIEEDEED